MLKKIGGHDKKNIALFIQAEKQKLLSRVTLMMCLNQSIPQLH